MKNKIIYTFFFLFFLPFLLFSQKTENIIIMVIDGSRYSETFGDSTHQHIPNIWNKLRKQSTIFTNFYNDSVTKTNSGHSSILTGTWQNLPNDGSKWPTSPTAFEYFRKQLNATENENFVILGKSKLDMLSYSSDTTYGEPYKASIKYSTDEYNDRATLKNTLEVLSSQHPRLALINLAQTDRKGHSGDWAGYLHSIKLADSIVFVTWNYLQQNPRYKNKTLFIVINDHGRHLNGVLTGFRDHGCSCEGCRHILLLMAGPGIPKNYIETHRYTQINIVPTISRILGFTCTSCSAEPITFPDTKKK